MGALIFALGTLVSNYSGTSILGAIVGIGGVYMLYALDGIGRRR